MSRGRKYAQASTMLITALTEDEPDDKLVGEALGALGEGLTATQFVRAVWSAQVMAAILRRKSPEARARNLAHFGIHAATFGEEGS